VLGHPASLTLSFMSLDSPRERGLAHAASRPSDSSFEEEFRAFYTARFTSLFTYLDRLTGDADLASDAAQEAFARLHRRGTMPDQPAGWLVVVASNVLRDERRRASRQFRLLTEEPSRAPSGTPPADPAAHLEQAERVRAVRAALEAVAPRDRQALLLRHAGYSYREIAAAVHLAEGSVGTTLVRAGQVFRRAFKEMHGAPE
jgi:RNA polymerase sigma-70 factor (ECF subfamily)